MRRRLRHGWRRGSRRRWPARWPTRRTCQASGVYSPAGRRMTRGRPSPPRTRPAAARAASRRAGVSGRGTVGAEQGLQGHAESIELRAPDGEHDLAGDRVGRRVVGSRIGNRPGGLGRAAQQAATGAIEARPHGGGSTPDGRGSHGTAQASVGDRRAPIPPSVRVGGDHGPMGRPPGAVGSRGRRAERRQPMAWLNWPQILRRVPVERRRRGGAAGRARPRSSRRPSGARSAASFDSRIPQRTRRSAGVARRRRASRIARASSGSAAIVAPPPHGARIDEPAGRVVGDRTTTRVVAGAAKAASRWRAILAGRGPVEGGQRREVLWRGTRGRAPMPVASARSVAPARHRAPRGSRYHVWTSNPSRSYSGRPASVATSTSVRQPAASAASIVASVSARPRPLPRWAAATQIVPIQPTGPLMRRHAGPDHRAVDRRRTSTRQRGCVDRELEPRAPVAPVVGEDAPPSTGSTSAGVIGRRRRSSASPRLSSGAWPPCPAPTSSTSPTSPGSA